MTSGTFHSVPLDSIIVKRDERQRRELSDISTLMNSISRLGLIHPLVITRDNELVAGERRYNACKNLGWTSVPVQYVDEVDDLTLQAIELEENIKRQDIEWKDQVSAISRYHKLRQSQEKGWVQEDTGKALGLSDTTVSKMLLVANELEQGNAMVMEAPKFSTAFGITERARQRHEAQVLEKLHDTFKGVDISEPATTDEPDSILTTDFTEWAGTSSIRFNFIHCDFPYGIGADSFNQGGAASHGGYDDTPEDWSRLMTALEVVTKLSTAQSAHLMFWFAMRKADSRLYEPTAAALERMGWLVNPMPLIWMKSDGAGILPDPERGPRQVYETCLLASRGDRRIVRAVANAYAAPTVRDRHMSEKPEPMLRHFFGMLVDKNTVLLDPTCGSGSALRAAESLGARYVLGLERDPEFASLARDALKRSRTLRKAQALVDA